MPESTPPSETVERLRAALTGALSARDTVAAAALRSALAAIANAEAVPVPTVPVGSHPLPAGSEHVAGAAAGLGATEAARRHLTEADMAAIVRAEISDRCYAADQYDRLGRTERAERLRREAAVLTGLTAA